jgi:hypothetical protein
MFTVGGVDIYIHKYLGANTSSGNATADQPSYSSTQPSNIQDLLFLENRDRTYDPEIYRARGFYGIQNLDFNLSQFGLLFNSDVIFLTLHINDIINILGRKPMPGDVIELPNLKQDYYLDDNSEIGMPRYYVMEDVDRSAEGFSATWNPHLYRIRCKIVSDNQQFQQIFDQPAAEGSTTTLRDLLSTFNQEIQINNQVVAQAEADAPMSGYETRQFYTLAVDPLTGKPVLETADETTLDTSNTTYDADSNNARPVRPGYTGYLVGDGYPPNGYPFGFGITFPAQPGADDFYLRTDFLPNRLFRFDALSNGWVKVEDAVRMDMTNNNSRQTLKTSFINNTTNVYFDSVASDTVTLLQGATTINTRISYTTGSVVPYIVLKQSVAELDFALSDYPSIYQSYTYTSPSGVQTPNCLRIVLPTIDGEQQTIPYPGQWTVTLYNTQEAQRQSISQALKPRADF